MNTDTALDLRFHRNVTLSPAQVWEGWTDPAVLMQWFCPRPWKVVECEVDLRPGGIFRTVMQSPDGKNMPANTGTFLSIEPQRRLVWTNALGPGFRPNPKPDDQAPGFFFVVDLTLAPLPDGGTSYTAVVMHQDAAGREAHAAMGFEQGWGIALDQLVDLQKMIT